MPEQRVRLLGSRNKASGRRRILPYRLRVAKIRKIRLEYPPGCFSTTPAQRKQFSVDCSFSTVPVERFVSLLRVSLRLMNFVSMINVKNQASTTRV